MLWKWMVCLSVLASLLVCAGCSPQITLGPRTETDIVFVRHNGVAARVARSAKVELVVEKDGKTYRTKMDIGGFYVISPDLKDQKPAPTLEGTDK